DQCSYADIMAAENVPVENVPALAPPIMSDDQILPYNSWNTNFFRAFTAIATIPTIYIQQFWNTIKDALGITPHDPAHPFVAPITSNALIDFVMELGYPRELSAIQSFISDRKKLSVKDKKKEPKTLLIPYNRFTKLIIYHLRIKHNFHPRTGFPLHIPDEDSVLGNLKFVAEGVKYEVFGMPIPDAYMMIINEMHDQTAQCGSVKAQNKVIDSSLTAELAAYKKQVELYERRAKFKLTEREQKIEEQLRIVTTDHNIKEENLKRELHSVKMQLNSTINRNKSMVEEVTSLKKNFKQKENKYLEEFLDMKALKEKVEDKLYKQDQSLQTVHMLCRPKPYYDEQRKVAIGYKNPLCLTRAKQV
ncbi:hypothetical protein Tco_0854417, partial [Tanacetum coccineum]